MRSKLDKSASPSEKRDFIFSHICNFEFPDGRPRNREGGAVIDITNCYMNTDNSYFGLSSYEEMVFYLNTLEQEGLISQHTHTATSRTTPYQGQVTYYSNCSITFKGLNYLSEIENKGVLSNKCFVAMPFDVKKKERLNSIKNACNEFKIDAFIVEEFKTKENQTIDSSIISAIKSSRFCIADFTGINQGAYFEAGYAMGRNMKVIFICEQKDLIENKKHFDVNHYPFIPYAGFDDLTARLKTEISSYIQD